MKELRVSHPPFRGKTETDEGEGPAPASEKQAGGIDAYCRESDSVVLVVRLQYYSVLLHPSGFGCFFGDMFVA